MSNTTDLPAMTGAEFKSTRELLGLPVEWMSLHLAVTARGIERWESEEREVPFGVATEMQMLARQTRLEVNGLAFELRQKPAGERTFWTYRTDADFRGPYPNYPASWHRAIAARVFSVDPETRVRYA